MINAAPSSNPTMPSMGFTPTVAPLAPAPAAPMMPTLGDSDQPKKTSLLKKFTPKVILGLIILLIVVVGSGAALVLNSQQGRGDIRQQAAGVNCGDYTSQNACSLHSDKCKWEYNPSPGKCVPHVPVGDGCTYLDIEPNKACTKLECKGVTVTDIKCSLGTDKWLCGTKNWLPMPPTPGKCTGSCPWNPLAGGECCPQPPDNCQNVGDLCYVPDPFVAECTPWATSNYECPANKSNYWKHKESFLTLEELFQEYPGIKECGGQPDPTPEPEPSPTPTSTPTPTPEPVSCDSICTSTPQCQTANPAYACIPAGNDGINWSASSPWSGPVVLSSLPGIGIIAAQAETILPGNATLFQEIWRTTAGNNFRFFRTVPISPDGNINWSAATAWSNTGLDSMPGSGVVNSATYITQPNGQIVQGMWRGNLGYVRTITITMNQTVPVYTVISPWNTTGIAISALPCQAGSTMESQADYIVNNVLHQAIWCGNQGWMRTVPIVNGAISWSQPGAWGGPIAPGSDPNASNYIPGTGTMQSHTLIVAPNGYVTQGLWRGDQGWVRTIPLGNRCRLETNPKSQQCTPAGGPPPIACQSAAVTTPATPNLYPGQSATLSAVSTSPVNRFYFKAYNKNNLYDNGTPKPICVTSGGDVNTSQDLCEPGKYQLVFRHPDITTMRTSSGTFTRSYDQIFVNDLNNGGQKATNVQLNAVVAINDGTWTSSVPACVGNVVSMTSPTPPPPVSPSPVISPSPFTSAPPAPMCLSITKSVAAPVIGTSLNFTCGAVTGAKWYDFRVIQPDGKQITLAATGRVSANYTVAQPGMFFAQCRYCTTNVGQACNTAWEPLPSIVPPAPTSDPGIDPAPTIVPNPTSTPSITGAPKPSPTSTPGNILPPPPKLDGANN